jgi:predicted PurR-regulated permease PerM
LEVELIRSASPSNTPSSASSKATLVIAAGVTIAMLYFGRQIFIPLALALVLSFLLSPLVAGLQKARLGRLPSVLAVMLFCFALTVTVGWGVAGQLLEITSHIGDYRTNLEDKIRSVHEQQNTPLTQATATVQELNKALSAAPAEAAKAARTRQESGHPPRPVPVQVTAPPSNFVQDLRTLLGPLAGPAETAGLVIIFMVFILINREDLRNRLIRLGGEGRLSVMTQALEDASSGLSRYLLLQFLVNASFGSLFGIGLYFVGVPHALLWGAVAALLRFVPYVGTWIATAFPILMALATFPGWKQAGLAFALFIVLELTTANIIEPWLYGAHTGISPLAILVAAIFWATLWGPVGLILSTPLTLCLILVGRYVPQMNFLEVLLGDAPALTPQELFYQRLLAMDPDEARNVADSYLQDKTLGNLYEEVLIPALRLAEEDRHSDTLGDRSADFISQSTRELIDDLGDRSQRRQSGIEQEERSEDAPAVPQFSEAGIVCVPARDEADELVGMMLTQLLQKAGSQDSRFLSIGTVDNMLDQVERGGFAIVCVSALPPFAVGQARSLCKRLRGRLPRINIVVGLWGFAGGVTKAQERMAPASPDAVCTSLSDAMMQIRRLAEQRGLTTRDAGSQVTAA